MSMLIFDTRLTNPNTVANGYKSSEKAAFPATNAYDVNRRRKTWRSNGCFEIVEGENTLVFRETAGVDLTAVVVAGTYTSDTAFLAAVRAALMDAGVSTYAVARDTVTNRIKITSALSGGATVFQLQLAHADSADLAGILGFDTSANLTGATSYEADLLVIHTSEWLKWDFGFPVNPTGFIACGDRNSPLQISPTAVVKLQAAWTDSWANPAEEWTITFRDFLLGHFRAEGIAEDVEEGYRYWRMQIQDPQNNDGFVEFGVVFLGTHMLTTQGCPNFPFDAPNEDGTDVQFSEAGQTFAGRRPSRQRFTLNWNLLNNETAESLQRMWEEYGLHTSFVIAMDPASAFSTDGVQWMKIVKFDRDSAPRLISPGLWACNWNLREEL